MRRTRRTLGVLGCVALAIGLSLAPPAATAAHAAAPTHELTLIVTGEPKKLIPPPEGQFEDACGVAVDPSGDIYLSDYHHKVIDVFTHGGTYLTQIHDPDPDGPCGLAVDAAGNVYVNNWRRDVVRFHPSSFPPSAATTYGAPTVLDFPRSAGARSTGVFLDPASGALYVDERTYVSVFEAGQLGQVEPVPARTFGLGIIGEGYGVAVSDFPATAGDVYVPDATTDTVRVFGPAGEALPPLDGAGTPQRGFHSLADSAVAVDQTDGHLFVADNLEPGFERPVAVVDEFNPSGDYRGQLPGSFIAAGPNGLATDASGGVYVSSGNTEEARLFGFGPTLSAATLTLTTSGTGTGVVTSQPAGIHCGTACVAEYGLGEEVTLTAVPEPGSIFAGWSGAGCSGIAPCHVILAADTSVSAEFAPAPPTALLTAPQAPTPTPASATPSPAPAGAAPIAGTGVALLRLSAARSEGSGATLRAGIPAAGALTVSGPGLVSQALLESAAGQTTLHLRLKGQGRRALQRAKSHRLRVKVAVTFTPADGAPILTATRTATFEERR